MRRVSDRAGSTQGLRLASRVILPSASDNGVGISDDPDFAAQYLACRFPLSTLRLRPHGRIRMTRGRSDSLLLLRIELSSTISCQLLLAHFLNDSGEFSHARTLAEKLVEALPESTELSSNHTNRHLPRSVGETCIHTYSLIGILRARRSCTPYITGRRCLFLPGS